MADEKHSCSERVYSGARWDISGHPCQRNGSVERDGKWWCKQHDPEAVKARREAKRAKSNAEREADEALRLRGQALALKLGGQPAMNFHTFKYTGGVTLSQEQAEALVARLEELENNA